MKVIKHCHQDSTSPADDAQGVLLGLIMENKLEVTNCFPFPRSIDGVDDGEWSFEVCLGLLRTDFFVKMMQSIGHFYITLLDVPFSDVFARWI